jgi:hypothetical protein
MVVSLRKYGIQIVNPKSALSQSNPVILNTLESTAPNSERSTP